MDRAQQHHRERLNEAIREELTAILEGELGDPRIGVVAVTEVHLSRDGRSVRVFVQAPGPGDRPEQTIAGLMSAKGYVRRELAERLGLQRAPEVIFELDKSEQYGARIDELLKRVKERKRP